MHTLDEIIQFVEKHACIKNVQPTDDLPEKHGIYGDDWHELLDVYAEKYQVNCESYLWYFHTGEEGMNIPGKLLFKTPDMRVEHIAVTPEMLLDFANKGKWGIDYPEHHIPKERNDLVVNDLSLVIFIILAVLISLIIGYIK
ncbi:MAG: DUF1493 family protein [Chitinophagales bacterium]|nr:DUF1493 family protein [Chitinophagaceae bacterium]MCB9066142.1 DUF1493 family protein [Chitinophagales bacterium]